MTLSNSEHAISGSNPYVGPRPFENADRERFFGRDIEARDIVSSVIANPIFLLYAQSGAGKTSILNARLLPMLQQKGLDTLPPARVGGIASLDNQNWPNLYVFNVLTRWLGDTRYEIPPSMSIQQFLSTVLPVRRDEDGEAIPRVVCIDQFEELFTSYPHRWKEREDFLSQLADALQADPLLRILLVMREDYIAQLDPYVDLFVDRLRARIRLERLQRDAALASIVNPLKHTGRRFAVGAAEQLVDDLLQTRVELPDGKTVSIQGEFIEPVHLQVVCYRLWETLPAEITEINKEFISSYGNVDQALTSFYFNCIKTASQTTGIAELDLRQWVERSLITSAETRGTVYASSKDTDDPLSRAIRILEDMHLIRSEIRAGARWYELTHDRLIKPILDNRTTQEYGQARSKGRGSRYRIEFRQQEVGYIFERWRAIESVSLVGVGSIGKSNLLQHLSDSAVHEAYLGKEFASRFKCVLIDPNMLAPEAMDTSEAFKCWTGYELLLHRLYLTCYPFDMLDEATAQQFHETYQTFQDGTNPLFTVLGLRYFELGIELLIRSGIQLVFILDEFEVLLRQMPAKFFITLRGLRDRNKAQISFLTYTRTPLTTLVNELGLDMDSLEPFVELFVDNVLYITSYNEQDARDMVQSLMRRHQQNYDEFIIEFALWASGRFPGLLRVTISGLASIADLSPARVKTESSQILTTLSRSAGVQSESRTIWLALNEDERTVLRIVGGMKQKFEVTLQTQQAVSLLVQKGLLRVEKSTLLIQPPLFGAYVQQLVSSGAPS